MRYEVRPLNGIESVGRKRLQTDKALYRSLHADWSGQHRDDQHVKDLPN